MSNGYKGKIKNTGSQVVKAPNAQKGGSGGGADLKSILAFIGIVCLVIIVPLVGYLAVNYIRRAAARNKRRRRRQSRRRSR